MNITVLMGACGIGPSNFKSREELIQELITKVEWELLLFFVKFILFFFSDWQFYFGLFSENIPPPYLKLIAMTTTSLKFRSKLDCTMNCLFSSLILIPTQPPKYVTREFAFANRNFAFHNVTPLEYLQELLDNVLQSLKITSNSSFYSLYERIGADSGKSRCE